MPPADLPIRAVFFDAGNTLLRMNYAVIAAELARHGLPVTADAVQRAEWRARVRLDDEVLSRWGPGDSTENRSTAERYLGYLLDGLGVTDKAIVDKIVAWRRGYNPPVGYWNTVDPQAAQALDDVRRAGLRAAVISNSNGSVRSILESLGLVAGPERRAQLRDRAAAVIAADAVGLDGALLPGLGEADVTRLSLGGGEAPSVKVFLDGRPDSRPSEVAAAARLLCATRSSAASASP